MRRSILLSTCIVVGLAASAGGARAQADVAVEQPWARASIGTSRPAAAYLTLVNSGGETALLVAVTTPVAGRAEVHRTVKQGDVLRMEPAGDVAVPPGGQVVFAPGGLHVMLMELKEALERGATFPLTLQFEDGGLIQVTVPVMGPGAMGPEE